MGEWIRIWLAHIGIGKGCSIREGFDSPVDEKNPILDLTLMVPSAIVHFQLISNDGAPASMHRNESHSCKYDLLAIVADWVQAGGFR